MKSRPIKFCCLLITMAMLLQMLPVQVLGAKHTVLESENVAFQEVIQDEFVDISAEDAVVVKEITERRTQFSKEFLLSNGFSMAVVYPEAVHYEEDNTWKEIDNSLKVVGSGTNARYVNTAGEWTVSFPQQLGDKKVVTISRDGYTLSFGLAGKLRVSSSPNIAVKSLGRIEDQVETQLAVDSGKLSSAVIEDLDFTVIRESMEHPETFVGSIFSQLKYNNIYDNTDIIYDLNSKGVKESIVIEAYDPNLYGYQYTLNTGTMVPVLEEDGSVALYSPDRSEVVMMMPAPYMIDEAGAISYDVRVTLEAKGSVYTLAYHMPMDWLADDERAWPVVLDPVVEATSNVNNILDQTIMEHYAVSYMSGALHVGYDTSNGKMWTFLEYVDLPQLSSGDVIVNASVSLYRFNGVGSGTTIEVHKVKETWSSSTITWAEKPECDPIVEDYAHVNGTGRYYWEITDIARGWYEGENTGLMFKATDAIESAGAINWQKFYSIDYSKYAVDWWPYLYITYRNNSGLESYWDYTVNGVGRAGTGYVHDYTGNLVWVRDDLGFGGNRMPVSISHIYNADDRDSNNYGMGYGWKTNFNQTVKPVAANINASYVWEDGDGTDHYFVYDSSTGTYKDEDGLELTLAAASNGITITDKYGNTSYFDAAGRLFKQENNQEEPSSIEITYTSSESFLISSIKDGAGRWYYFTYNSSNLLEKITYTGKGSTEITSVTYSYSGEMLSVITDKDGDGTSFGYVGGNLLSQIQDVDGYRLVYTYTEGSPKRVASISEYQGDVLGGVLTFSYAHNQTTIQDHNGNVQIMQFNDWGNTICIQDGEGRAQYAQYAMNHYTETDVKQNQLIGSSKMQNTVGNLLYEISFENNLFWWPNATELDVSRTTEDAYLGDYCLKAVTDVENTYFGAFSQSFAIAPGETVTISAYVKNPDAPAHIALHHNDGVIYHTFPGETLPASNKWVRTEITYTNTFDYVVSACVYLFTPHPGTYYLDCVQAEKASTASRYNLVDNGDFQDGFYAWLDNSGELVTLDSSAAPGLNNTVHKMVGSPDADQHLYHYIYESGSAGDSYVFGCWAKGNAVPLTGNDRAFGIRLTFENIDESKTVAYASFNTDLPDNGNWQYISAPAVAEKDYSKIIIETVYNGGANTVYFDGIQVFKENFGSSYTYDEKGNIKTVVDIQNQETKYEYNSQTNDLTRIIQNNKAKVTYEYDTYHNVTKATTEAGLVYTFEYDDWGNNTSVSIEHDGARITSTAEYSADGNVLESTTDALDKTTEYGYNEDTNVLEWVQYPEDTAETRTEYSYDEMYRLASVTANVDTGYSLDASYIYADDLLTCIETNSTIYNFSYGNFAQRSSVQIGSRTLASYEYTNDQIPEDQDRYLKKLTYGNGDTVEYEYDSRGRVTKETFEDGSTVTYEYDNTGALATVTDSATGRKTKYYYDLTDRLMKYVESGSGHEHSVEYTYNKRNNLSVMKEITDGRRLDYYYSYDSDNRLREMEVENYTLPDYTRVTYYYDDHGRLYDIFTEYSAHWGVSKRYTFDNPSDNETTTQVVHYKVDAYEVVLDFDITYDDNGNITSVQSGSNCYTYAYDSANQLIREDNTVANKTWVWTYDNAGNILSRKEYAYTTGSLGPVLDTVNYTYGDDSWGDLLTAYDGVPITYDTIGNPLNDGTWTYTWQNGRELASMSNGTTTWTYAYDANGMRTSRTNGAKTYNYVYNGSQLTQITVGNDTLYFVYDATGAPVIGIWNNSAYYYITSLQGDVIRILDEDGEIVVSYEYDAWGNVIQVGGPMAGTLGTLNPLRYRGYVYDVETGLYYLQSRYYNPEIGRFINADVFTTTGQGLLGNNMFAYCLNNPIKFSDPTGTLAFPTIAAIAIIATGGIVGGILGAFNAATTDGNILESAIEGCINGLIGSTCGLLITNPVTAIAIAGGTSMIVDAGVQATTQYFSTRDISQIDIDIGRMVKTGVQTGLGTAVPQLGKATGNAVDAFGTALIWAETSTVIVCADIAYTNLTKPKPTSTGYDSGVGGGHQGQSVIKATISCVCLY